MKALLSTAVVVAIVIIALVQFCRECKRQKKNLIYSGALILIFLTVTLTSAWGWLCPVIIRTDGIKEPDVMGKSNIAFKTKLKIVEPVNLKIADTYLNLALQVDYACVDNFVFINYQFGNNEETDRMIRGRGFKFTYKARAFILSKEYNEYQGWLENTRKLKKMKEEEVKNNGSMKK